MFIFLFIIKSIILDLGILVTVKSFTKVCNYLLLKNLIFYLIVLFDKRSSFLCTLKCLCMFIT